MRCNIDDTTGSVVSDTTWCADVCRGGLWWCVSSGVRGDCDGYYGSLGLEECGG